jgi:hypothetical protein
VESREGQCRGAVRGSRDPSYQFGAARLAEGGRLVAITGRNPDQPAWRDSFIRLQERGRVVFTAALAGQAYARHGTSIETRLTVIDCVSAETPAYFRNHPVSPHPRPNCWSG